MEKYIVDVYPKKAQFIKGEPVEIIIELNNPRPETVDLSLEVKVLDLIRTIETKCCKVNLCPGDKRTLTQTLDPKEDNFKGFGVDVTAFCGGEVVQVFSGAFDVVADWRMATRYGFLSDFGQEDLGAPEDVKSMAKLHINLVQFYDWMYRHDRLAPPTADYQDLMGRKLNLNAVKEKVKLCHAYGMKAIAYGAVYAASREFYDNHRDWALYDSNDHVFNLGELFYIMNISSESPWRDHVIEQYIKAVTEVGFDGIHMDTYGFPKVAFSKLNNESKIIRLEEEFPGLIADTRQKLSKVINDPALIFNAVGNWPLEAVAGADQDVVYIEVWKPYERYHHLQQIIKWAKFLSKGKPVILAAYLKPFSGENGERTTEAETAALVLTAVIAANGGYHLIFGEEGGVLTEGYYVNYQRVGSDFFRIIRNYYDFIVRYSNLLFDDKLNDVSMTHVDGDNLEYIFENFPYSTYGEPGKIWVVVREKPKRKTISLINLLNNTDDLWNKGKVKPTVWKGLTVKIQVFEEVKSVFYASPDFDMGRPIVLEYTIEKGGRGKYLVINIPEVFIWGLITVDFE